MQTKTECENPFAGQIDKHSDTNWWLWLAEENEFGRLGRWMTKKEIAEQTKHTKPTQKPQEWEEMFEKFWDNLIVLKTDLWQAGQYAKQFLQTQIKEAEERAYEDGRDNAWLGVSKWKEMGEKYKYFDFFEKKAFEEGKKAGRESGIRDAVGEIPHFDNKPYSITGIELKQQILKKLLTRPSKS